MLGISYAISGLCSGHWGEYGWRNLLFAVIQFVAVAGLYWLFSLLPGGLGWLLVRFALAVVIPNALILLLNAGSDELHYLIGFVKKKFLRK